MSCSQNPINIDDIKSLTLYGSEDNWVHDDELHSHQKVSWYMWKVVSNT